MQYKDLDIHQRINLKGTYEAFVRIMIERFQGAQDKVIYRTRVRGKNKIERTRYLRENFSKKVQLGALQQQVELGFPMYGRYVDMGVGRGTNINAAQLKKRYRSHHRDASRRKPLRWYSKTKAGQEKKLAEILAARYGMGLVKMAENALSQTVRIAA